MKKLIFILLVTFTAITLYAQKNTTVFLSFGPQFGFPVGKTIIEQSEYIGFHSQKEYYGPIEPEGISIHYGVGVQAGINIKDIVSISSGINYNKREDQLALYCHVCDFIMPPMPEKMVLSAIQVPLIMRVNLNGSAKFFPFASGGIYWNHQFENDLIASWSGGKGGLNFWSYSVGGGLGLRTQKNIEFLFKVQYNHDMSDRTTYPNMVFRDLSFAIEGVYKFSSGE